ncbi:MAG TPA: tetratricopeptide repeat protein [Ktedonobacterales bacterium]
MNGYAVWLLWIGGFSLLGIASSTRLLTWRGRFSAVSLSTFVFYLLVSLVGVGVGLYQLLTTSPTRLAAPVEGALLVQSVADACLVVVLAARELYIWSSWRLTSRGAKLIAQERYAQALRVYERLHKRRIYGAIAWTGKTIALQQLGRCEEAIACADEALRLTPQNARIWMIKGQALLALRRDAEALAALDQGSALAPLDATFLATQGVALYRLGQPAEALAEQALTLAPRQPRAYLAQALALERLGRVEEMHTAAEQGIIRVEHFLNINPARPDYLRLKAQFLQLLGHEQEITTQAHDV